MIETFNFKNGIRVAVENIPTAKTISCFFDFNAGSIYEKDNEYDRNNKLGPIKIMLRRYRTI